MAGSPLSLSPEVKGVYPCVAGSQGITAVYDRKSRMSVAEGQGMLVRVWQEVKVCLSACDRKSKFIHVWQEVRRCLALCGEKSEDVFLCVADSQRMFLC